MEYNHCYVIAPNRSAITALAFLDKFVPLREPTWHVDDPVEVLGISSDYTFEDILDFLEHHIDRSYYMVFRSLQPRSPWFADLKYNEDGSLILGLSSEYDDDGHAAWELLSRLEDFVGSRGLFMGESGIVPLSQEEFFADVESFENYYSRKRS